MTINELYEWAKENDVADRELYIDHGGTWFPSGTVRIDCSMDGKNYVVPLIKVVTNNTPKSDA